MAHLQATVYVKETFSVLTRSFHVKVGDGRMPCHPATGVQSPEGALRFLSSLLFPVKVIA